MTISTLGPFLLGGDAVLWWAWISPNLGNRWAWSTYRNMHKRPANINNSTDGRSTEQTKLHTEKQVLVSESVPTKHAERHEYCIAFAKVTVPRTHTFSAMPGKASRRRTWQMAILAETGSKSYCFHIIPGCLQHPSRDGGGTIENSSQELFVQIVRLSAAHPEAHCAQPRATLTAATPSYWLRPLACSSASMLSTFCLVSSCTDERTVNSCFVSIGIKLRAISLVREGV